MTIAYLGSLTFQLSNVITVLGHVNVVGSTLHLSHHGHAACVHHTHTPPGEVEEKVKRSAFICIYIYIIKYIAQYTFMCIESSNIFQVD